MQKNCEYPPPPPLGVRLTPVRSASKTSQIYTFLTNLSTKYSVMCKGYTGVGGIKKLYNVCPPVRKIILSLKLVYYLHVQADNPWYNYYLFKFCTSKTLVSPFV